MITAAGAVAPPSAYAYHTYKTRLLDTTAYSLERREWRIGLFEIGYGILNRLEITTYTMPWLLGLILEDVAPNLQLQSTLYNRHRLALSVSFAFFQGKVEATQIDGNELNTTKVNYVVIPVGGAASVRINPAITTSYGVLFTATDVIGGSQPADNDVRGAAVVNMLQLYAMLEWRISRVTSFTFTTRWLPYVSDTVVNSDIQIDPNTGAIIGVEVQIFDLTNAFALIPGFAFSWKRANLRFGVGYGDFFIHGLGLVIPGSELSNISAEFDVFVRF